MVRPIVFRPPCAAHRFTGTLAWSANPGAGTTKGASDPLALAGRYPLHWTPYAQVGAGGMGRCDIWRWWRSGSVTGSVFCCRASKCSPLHRVWFEDQQTE